MDIDFIKWLVGYAEGFEIINKLKIIKYKKYDPCRIKDIEGWTLYPLLLQRAIEGINKGEGFELIQTRSNIVVYNYEGSPPLDFELEPKNEDEAKEEALEYIWEQEK